MTVLYYSKVDTVFNLDLTQLPNAGDPMKQVDTKTKTALTRTYNKLVIKRSYNVEQKVKGKKAKKANDNDNDNDEDEQSDQNDRCEYYK